MRLCHPEIQVEHSPVSHPREGEWCDGWLACADMTALLPCTFGLSTHGHASYDKLAHSVSSHSIVDLHVVGQVTSSESPSRSVPVE